MARLAMGGGGTVVGGKREEKGYVGRKEIRV